MLPGIHWPELLLALFIAAMLFGAKRLPELGSSVGKTIREFQKSLHEITDPVKDAMALPPVPPQSPAAPASPPAASMLPAAIATPAIPGHQQTTPQSAHLADC